MILEIAMLDVMPGREIEFQEAFAVAEEIIRSMLHHFYGPAPQVEHFRDVSS